MTYYNIAPVLFSCLYTTVYPLYIVKHEIELLTSKTAEKHVDRET